jgi:hypothetical protein
MLPHDAVVLFVNADRVLNLDRAAIIAYETTGLGDFNTVGRGIRGIQAYQVVDASNAVTAKRKIVSHRTHSIFTTGRCEYRCQVDDFRNSRIEGKLSRMRVFRSAIWDHHLCERHAVEDWPQRALVVIRHC